MKEITKNVRKVAERLFSTSDNQERFLGALSQSNKGISAVVWTQGRPSEPPFELKDPPSWLPPNIDVVSESVRPGRSPEHERGDIYSMDLSSVFACVPFGNIQGEVSVVIDVCAAPGGKGIVAWSRLSPKLIIANEVIGKRTAQLISNYRRCRISTACITSMDSEPMSSRIPGVADLVIVDAPCSGQSLVMKELAAPGAFHPATVSMNAKRQRRILAQSSRLVKPGGMLVYATCTFSREENEENVEWFLKTFAEFRGEEVDALRAHRSVLSDAPAYRLWPFEGLGAGSFCAVVRRSGENLSPVALDPMLLIEPLRVVWRSPCLLPPGALLPARKADRNRTSRVNRGKGKGGKKDRRWRPDI